MAEELTIQQQEAVFNRGGKLLVSAAAGSGKTKVLVDRLLSYITDTTDPANIDDFLIITYTKAAASELRAKIAQKISEKIAENPQNLHLQKQMQRLYLAKISTVHSFCTEILRENAYRMDLASDFRVSEERDSVQLQLESIETVLEGAYAHIHENEQVRDFLDSQGLDRNDFKVPPILLSVYRSAKCHLEPEAWLKRCETQADAEGIVDASETVWGAYLICQLHDLLDGHINALEQCIQQAEREGNMPGVVQLLNSTVNQFKMLRGMNRWDDIALFPGVDYGRLTFPKKGVDPFLCEQIKEMRKSAKKDVDAELCCFSDPSERVLSDLRTSSSAAKGLITLVRQFSDEYERQKKRRRLLDFSDLEHRTLDLLLGKKRTGITTTAREIGRRFREVMVDEYQDSNGVQDAIFSALTDERQNCFMVGDVKQSIYQFRLADPSIFIKKYNEFEPVSQATAGQGRKVNLSSNFRSSGEIINAVNDVFVQSMSEKVGGLCYTENEKLHEGLKHVPLNEPEVEFYAVDAQSSAPDEEAAFVAERILTLLDGSHMVRDKKGLRPINAGDIVIILRSHRSSGGHFIHALHSKGIACTMGGNIDLLQTEEVSVLISMLQVIVNPQQDIPLVAAMVSRVFGFTADDLAKIRGKNTKISLYDTLKKDTNDRVKQFLKLITELRKEAQIYRLSEFIERIIEKTNLMSMYFAMQDGDERCKNLHAFCQIASDFGAGGQRDLGQFLDYLSSMANEGILIESDQTDTNAVTIMSIHSSKGLEFPVVFLCGQARTFNRESSTQPVLCHKELGLGMNYIDQLRRVSYPTIAKNAISRAIITESISEEMRVLYVAMTRARDRLIMTYSSTNLESKLTKLSLVLPLSPRTLLTSNASAPGDWIIQTALSRSEAGELFAIGGNPGISKISESPWLIRVVEAEPVQDVVSNVKECENCIPKETLEKISAGISFIYPHLNSVVVPSKQTATQLKGREKDKEIAEHTYVKRSTDFCKPSFVQQKHSGTAKGNAIHKFMQYVNISACNNKESIQAECARLLDQNIITCEEVDLIDLNGVLSFFQSDIGKKLRYSDVEILREFKFSVLVDAQKYYPEVANEKILLQGVVDCALIEDQGITVIDFKSDNIRDIGQLIDKYRAQVEAYAEAMSKIFERPVIASYLYLFSVGQFVKLS